MEYTLSNSVLRTCYFGDLDSLKAGIQQDPTQVHKKTLGGNTVLHMSAGNGHKNLVKYICELDGVELHAKNGEGNTPLALACFGGHTGVVQYLLGREDASPLTMLSIRNRANLTPLDLAKQEGQDDTVRLIEACVAKEEEAKD